MSNHHHESNSPSAKVKAATGESVMKCYQCGKCSAGCPLASDMDFPPSQIMRLLQTNMPENEDKAVRSHTAWLCLACEMCHTRCPMEIDIPKVMDYLREKSLHENKANPKAKNIIAFHKSFLSSIEKTGRLYEMGLIIDYKMKSMNLMQDVSVAPKLLSKGKLHLMPENIKDKANISRIFSKTIKKREGNK